MLTANPLLIAIFTHYASHINGKIKPIKVSNLLLVTLLALTLLNALRQRAAHTNV